eukprot:scaffold442764_cov59-Attheya_sp.AAC.1
MTKDEKEIQKRNNGRKKPFSCSQMLPLGVGETVCDCIANMSRTCARKKLGANLSEAEMEYVQITHAMEFLRIDSTVETAKRLVKMAASNAAVAGAVSSTSVVTVDRIRWAFVGAVVLMTTILSPIPFIINKNKPTPSPSPYLTITPKVQCPDAGAAMFAGYKVSNTSDDRQLLLMVALVDLPERLELFLMNSFTLPTMSEEFAGNKMGFVK